MEVKYLGSSSMKLFRGQMGYFDSPLWWGRHWWLLTKAEMKCLSKIQACTQGHPISLMKWAYGVGPKVLCHLSVLGLDYSLLVLIRCLIQLYITSKQRGTWIWAMQLCCLSPLWSGFYSVTEYLKICCLKLTTSNLAHHHRSLQCLPGLCWAQPCVNRWLPCWPCHTGPFFF